MNRPTAKTRIVIAGGCFAGLYAAKEFERALAQRCDIELTLISRENLRHRNEVAASAAVPPRINLCFRGMLKQGAKSFTAAVLLPHSPVVNRATFFEITSSELGNRGVAQPNEINNRI